MLARLWLLYLLLLKIINCIFLAIIEGTNICDECAPECATCNLAFNSKECLRCANNYYLNDDNNACL